jgi:hypothetical protein
MRRTKVRRSDESNCSNAAVGEFLRRLLLLIMDTIITRLFPARRVQEGSRISLFLSYFLQGCAVKRRPGTNNTVWQVAIGQGKIFERNIAEGRGPFVSCPQPKEKEK